MKQPPLTVEVVRDGVVESTHLLDVAVLGADGALVASAGDPEMPAAFRSSAKPLQAAASRALGWSPSCTEHLAIASASHLGEPIHVGAVRRLLSETGLNEDALRCPEAWPYLPDDAAWVGRPRRVQHNCSGKHAGFLAGCAAAGLPLENYRSPDHPLQVEVRNRLEAAAGVRASAVLTDGCGAPTLVFPLSAIARAFLAVHATTEADAMLAHPHLISGTGRLDTALLSAGVVTKGGAEGLSCAVGTARADGPLGAGTVLAVAAKVRDGSVRARAASLVAILSQLGMLAPDEIDPVIANPPTLGGGKTVGSTRLADALAI